MQGKPILPSMPHVTWKILTTNLNEVRSNLEQNMGCLGFAVRSGIKVGHGLILADGEIVRAWGRAFWELTGPQQERYSPSMAENLVKV